MCVCLCVLERQRLQTRGVERSKGAAASRVWPVNRSWKSQTTVYKIGKFSRSDSLVCESRCVLFRLFPLLVAATKPKAKSRCSTVKENVRRYQTVLATSNRLWHHHLFISRVCVSTRARLDLWHQISPTIGDYSSSRCDQVGALHPNAQCYCSIP